MTLPDRPKAGTDLGGAQCRANQRSIRGRRTRTTTLPLAAAASGSGTADPWLASRSTRQCARGVPPSQSRS
jgi:hypothetical protein